VLLNGPNTLFEPLDAFLHLTIGKLDKGTRLSELLVNMGSFLSMTPAQMHVKPFGHQLKFLPEPFSKDARMASGFSNVSPKFFPKPFRKYLSVPSRFGNVSHKFLPEAFRKYLSVPSRFGNASPKRFSHQLKLLSEPVVEIARMAPGIGNVSPKFFPEPFRKHLSVPSRIGNVGPQRFSHDLKFLPEPFSEDTGAAFGIGDVSTKFLPEAFRKYLSVPSRIGDVSPHRFSSRADDSLNLCQRFLVHTHSLAKRGKSRVPQGRSQRFRYPKVRRHIPNTTISSSLFLSCDEKRVCLYKV